jgi:nicotinamidase-related amidase
MVIPDGVAALRQAKRVVEFADANGIRVIHVQHVLPAGAPLFAQGSVNAAFHRDLQPRQGETVVQKDNVSVFARSRPPCSTAVLKNAGIDTLIVTGLQTHACVAGAARDAAPRRVAIG